jgi:hypothetical protein
MYTVPNYWVMPEDEYDDYEEEEQQYSSQEEYYDE